MKGNFLFGLFIIFLLVSIAVIGIMLLSLAKQGDERRDMIVRKASAKTFAVIVVYICFFVVKNIYLIVSGTDVSPKGMNPFVTLVTISLVYMIELFYHKRKYGD